MEIVGRSITENICGYLRAKIISGHFRPGEKLVENKLAASVGISRPPLREALRKLEEEHLVYTIPRKGTYVKEMSQKDIDEVYQARELIEDGAIEFFATHKVRFFPLIASFLSNASYLSFTALDDPDRLLVYRQKIADFHVKLVEEVGNSRITHFFQSLYLNLARYQYLYFSREPGALERSQEEHEMISKILFDGDYVKAKKCLKKHIRHAHSVQKQLLAKIIKE